MPGNTNTVTFVGNLCRAPELRFTAGGRAIASAGLAVNRRWQQNGEWQEQTSFFNLTMWGVLAENCAASLDKGARVIATGRLEQRSYETNEGEKRTVVDMIVDAIGPDLSFATVVVERIERDKTDKPEGPRNRQSETIGGVDPALPQYGSEEPF